MADAQSVVRYSPLHNVVFACIFQDEDKAGKAMLEFLINDPELIRRYRMVENGKRDVATRIAVAEEKAEARKNRENARALRNAGIDVGLIAQITGLGEAEINAL